MPDHSPGDPGSTPRDGSDVTARDGSDVTARDGSDVTARGRAALLGPAEVRALAEEFGVRPTKQLGQNFVHDANTVRRIVSVAGVGRDDVVLEVGPGLGSLTLALLDVVDRVVAVEIDPRLAERLPATVADRAPDLAGRLDVVLKDAMRVYPADLPAPRRRSSRTCPTTSRCPCCCTCSPNSTRCARLW